MSDTTPEAASAAARRTDYVRALREELQQLEQVGKTDRIAACKAELERVGAAPVERTTPTPSSTAAPVAPVAPAAGKRNARKKVS